MTESMGHRLGVYYNPPSLTPAILDVLERSERPMTLREIADAVKRRTTDITEKMARLERKGLVERQRIYITAAHMNGKPALPTWVYSPTEVQE